MSYKVMRFYFNDRTPRILKRGLTLEEAQEHCASKETSSSTCSPAKARRVSGMWFDGYDKEE
jgi:hypothetical protein